MTNPAAGDYYIIPVVNTSKALDVSGNNRNNGANVQIYARNLTDAQVWRVSYRRNGTAQITSRFTGKSLDIPGANLVSGANVQMYTDNDTRAQEWMIDEKSTVDISGVTYPTYEVYLARAATLCMDVRWAGTSDGTNVWVYTRNNGGAQRWAFVPTPPFRSGGVYEIKSMLKTSLNLDVSGGFTANGVNVQLYPDNDTNAQKFVITDEGNGWSIRNVASGKYVDVQGANFKDGTNVQSYQDNDSRAQRWSVTTYGTAGIGGQSCQVVSFGADNAKSFVMDVSGAIAAANRNVIIYHSHGGNNQRFALFPTWAIDPHMPTPTQMTIGKTPTGQESWAHWLLGNEDQKVSQMFYPSWRCADAWATSGPNSYQWRYRYRYMSSSRSTWNSWGPWTSWLTALVTRDGNRSVVTQGLPVEFSLDDRKCCQIQFEVRACGADELSLLYGAAASCTCTFYYRPTVKLGNAAWSPEGLRIACTTDYPKGVTHLYVKSVKWGGEERLRSEVACKQLDDDTSFLIPQSELKTIPSDNQSVQVTFDTGTDQFARFGSATQTQAVTVSLDTTAAETVTFAEGPNRVLLATAANIGVTKMWMILDGEARELPRVSASSGKYTFAVPYPFGREYAVITSGRTVDSDAFYVDRKARMEAGAAHGWFDMGNGAAWSIEVREGEPIVTESAVDAVYDAHVLNSRAWETVTFAETRQGRFTASGAIIEGVTGSSYEDIEAMVGQHLLYRSPSGDVCQVAVVSCSRTSHAKWDDVSVTMVRETI